MCFSAQMSFIASALLTGTAALSYKTVRKLEQVPFATIPALFAIQQLAEGILWLLLPGTSQPITIAMYTFLTVAFIIWPVFLPFALLMLEENFIRRLIIATCLTAGIAWSFITTWYFATYGATVQLDGGHLYYQVTGLTEKDLVPIGLYCVITVLPFLASSNRALQVMGGIGALAVVVTYVFWYMYFISVWCFFVAILSLCVYYILRYHLD